MFRKITLFYLIFLFASCGKDVVIIEDPTPPTEIDETFEVNLVGFTTNETRAYLANMNVLIDGKSIQSDESAFFHIENVFIGRKGKIIQLDNEGYLPSIFRAANHQSLENVMLNLQMVQAPVETTVDVSGGNIKDDKGELIIGNGVLSSATDFVFKSYIGKDANLGNEDQLFFGNKTEFLLKEASLYVLGSTPLTTNSEIEVIVDASEFNSSDLTELSTFQFDESELTWKQREIQLTKNGDKISFPIDGYGWWTIAEKVPAIYGSLDLRQEGELPIRNVEVNMFYENETYSGSTLYTSATGTISTYFPAENSITTSLDNGSFKSENWPGFETAENIGKIEFTELVQVQFESEVYDCDFTFSDGYVALKSEGQHKLIEINSGLFKGEVFTTNNDVILQFYSTNYNVLNNKESDSETIKSEGSSFFSCTDLNDNLIVSDGTNLIENFDMCRVKVRPKETVVIGEKSDGETFLVSFEGEKEGSYNGLFYNDKVLEDVKAEVIVNIVLYDEIENKVVGFIKTEFISTGEELTISFIGNIE